VLAAILESGDPERLYTGLSLLVSAASAGEEARALIGFGALRALLDPDLAARATHVVDAEREPFARTLDELRAVAGELPNCHLWACGAAVQAAGATAVPFEGVTSMPAFLREVGDARLVFV
jgi:peroxiredoxin family protein